MVELSQVVADFAQGMISADAHAPQAVNVRSGEPFQPGLGPHTENQTTELVIKEIRMFSEYSYSKQIALEVPYPKMPRSKCDLCIGDPDSWEWVIEIKMMRLMGDNGKPNDNILMHILSPYPAHRSAVTDCRKLLDSGLSGQKAILIYGYDYDQWPMEPAISAFEVLASREVWLSTRCSAKVTGLIHPVHQRGEVYGWEIRPK